MTDTTIKKVQAGASPMGDAGQRFLASGKHVAMRIWVNEAPTTTKTPHASPYETVGFVIAGRAELHLEGQTVTLEPGDSWLVPADATHHYTIVETFTAVEATSPPAHAHGGAGA